VEVWSQGYSRSASSQHSQSRSVRLRNKNNANPPFHPIAEEGGGENEVVQQPNAGARAAENARANVGVQPPPVRDVRLLQDSC
jgi:hypothetical protein